MHDTLEGKGQQPSQPLPSINDIEQRALQFLGHRPCKWQCEVALAILRRQDTICIAPTGAGKTLTFWLPLLFSTDNVVVVVTPLNILGAQNREKLKKLGISAIAIDGENATDVNVTVRLLLLFALICSLFHRTSNMPGIALLWSIRRSPSSQRGRLRRYGVTNHFSDASPVSSGMKFTALVHGAHFDPVMSTPHVCGQS